MENKNIVIRIMQKIEERQIYKEASILEAMGVVLDVILEESMGVIWPTETINEIKNFALIEYEYGPDRY